MTEPVTSSSVPVRASGAQEREVIDTAKHFALAVIQSKQNVGKWLKGCAAALIVSIDELPQESQHEADDRVAGVRGDRGADDSLHDPHQMTASVRASGEPQKAFHEPESGGRIVRIYRDGSWTEDSPTGQRKRYSWPDPASASPSDDGARQAQEPKGNEMHVQDALSGRPFGTFTGNSFQPAAASDDGAARQPRSILVDRDADVRREMRAYLDTLTINGDNIGDIRRSLFMPFNSQWNGWVREDTAAREKPAPVDDGAARPQSAQEQLDSPTLQKFYNLTTRLMSVSPTGRVDLGATQAYHDALLALTMFRDQLRRDKTVVHDESFWGAVRP